MQTKKKLKGYKFMDRKEEKEKIIHGLKDSILKLAYAAKNEMEEAQERLSTEEFKNLCSAISTKAKESITDLVDWANDLYLNSISDVDKLSRAECAKYLKVLQIETPFDIDEASGDEMRDFIKKLKESKASNKTTNPIKDWKEKIRDFYKFEKETDTLSNSDETQSEKTIEVEVKDSQADDETELEVIFKDKNSKHSKNSNVLEQDMGEFEKEYKEFCKDIC